MRVLLICGFIALFLSSCRGGEKVVDVTELNVIAEHFCNADSLGDDQKYTGMFGNASTRSIEIARSGKFSSRNLKGTPYGMDFKLKDVSPGDFITITIWRKSSNNNGYLVVSGDKGFQFKKSTNQKSLTDSSGWDQLNISFTAPIGIESQQYKIFAYNPNSEVAYFDDMRITHYGNRPSLPGIKVQLKPKDFDKLVQRREEAFRAGCISSDLKKKIKSEISFGDKEPQKGSVKLKGDWTDHIEGGKWSLRVELDKGKKWKDFKTFSISGPHTRNFLNEWVFHEVLERENVLTSSYGFVPVEINKVYMGVYSYEQYFDKFLLKSRKRKRGPILKLQENAIFEQSVVRKEFNRKPNKPFYAASEILVYDSKDVEKPGEFREDFLLAQNLLFQFKNGKKLASGVFVVEKMAKYAALIDVFRAFHARQWHNLRFYYNPEEGKLEPIGYDGYTDGFYDAGMRPISGLITPDQITNEILDHRFYNQIFTDPVFVEAYQKYLSLYSSENYLKNFYEDINDQLEDYLTLLQTDYSYLRYDASVIFNSAAAIRKELPVYEKFVQEGTYVSTTNLFISDVVYSCEGVDSVVLNSVSLKAYYDQISQTMSFYNFHCAPIKVIGFSDKEDKSDLQPADVMVPSTFELIPKKAVKIESKFFNYFVAEINGVQFLFKVMPWPAPQSE